MPPPATVDELGDDVLESFYDRGSLERGRAYADEGRATVLSAEPGTIDAVCLGSGRASYVVRIRWSSGPGILRLDDTCTCPLGGSCKHCVATILTVRRSTPTQGSAVAASPERDWRRVLAELATTEDAAADVASTGLALEFAVHHPTPSRYVTDTGPRVTLRPMRKGKNGAWIKTGASWKDLASPHAAPGVVIDPLQRAALKALMASGPSEMSYSNTQTAPLDRFGPDLWFQLERAVEVGVELIGEHPDDEVVLSPSRAAVRIDVRADERGDVTLSTAFTLDGQPLDLPAGRSGVIGHPTHGLWIRDGGRLDVIGLAAPLHRTVSQLATTDALVVPADDVEELLDLYHPGLVRHAAVESSDGSVAFTTSRFDGIVLQVERTALDVARLTWVARYRRGERTVDHPMLSGRGRARDRAAESAVVSRMELPTHLLPLLVDVMGTPRDLVVSGPAVVTLFAEVIPWLEDRGEVQVELTGDLPTLREATEDPLISLVVSDGDDERGGANDWFDLQVEVSVDGQTVDFASLFAALVRADEALILPSGTWLRLDRPEFSRLRELIDEARGLAEPRGAGVVRLNRFQSSWWDELTSLGVVTEQSQRWADSIGAMAALSAPEPVAPPAGLEATLRHYQQDGLDWLAFLHRNHLGGILADDMGLGKTIQTLALCLHVKERDPGARFLVVAPTSVVDNWAREAAHFAPGLEVRTIRETSARRRTSIGEAIEGADSSSPPTPSSASSSRATRSTTGSSCCSTRPSSSRTTRARPISARAASRPPPRSPSPAPRSRTP